MTVIEMRRKRANLWEQAKAIHERAKEEQRDLDAQDRERWDALNAEIDSLKEQIDREERHAELEAEMAAAAAENTGRERDDCRSGQNSAEEYRTAFWAYMKFGNDGVSPEQRTLLRTGFQVAPAEARALATANMQAGGFTVADEDMGAIVDAMRPYGGIRQSRAEVITTATGGDFPVPTNDDTGNTGARVGENTQIAELDVTVGQKVFHSYLYTSRIIRVPYTFLQDTSIADFEGWLIGKLGERIGRITNTEFTLGAGNNMPEGVATASVLGATAAVNNAIAYDELIDLEHSVNAIYRRNAEYMFADSTLRYLRELVDGNGRPLWAAGIASREPDTLNGYRYVINDDVAAIGAGARSVLFGDMRNFKVRDVKGFTLLRLVERYADFLQVGFLGFSRHDSGLVDAGQHPIRHLAHP